MWISGIPELKGKSEGELLYVLANSLEGLEVGFYDRFFQVCSVDMYSYSLLPTWRLLHSNPVIIIIRSLYSLGKRLS